MKKELVIGLDIGTTSAKAVLFHISGKVMDQTEELYPISSPTPLWAEQDPFAIEKATLMAIKRLVQQTKLEPQQLNSIGLSSAMHSLICINEKFEPLSPSIIWADRRSSKEAHRIREEYPHIYHHTGTPSHPMAPLAKLLWMKENRYQPYIDANKFVSIKEFLLLRWFGFSGVDYAIASATGLFNIHTFDWDEDALSLAGIRRDQLSNPVPPTETYQGLKRNIAEAMGLPADIPVVIGASDGPLANLGVGAIHEGEIAITIGTSGAIRRMVLQPQLTKNQEIFCYAFLKNQWIMGGPTNNGAIVLQWLRELLSDSSLSSATAEVYEELTRLASKVAPGANGLLFLPYLTGERAPYWDAHARGSYIGLHMSHKKEHLIRAGLEGVLFNLFTISETMRQNNATRILASGGFARSKLWVQILADIFGMEVDLPFTYQSSAWGAAWLSLYAIGEVESLPLIKKYIPIEETFSPSQENNTYYQQLYGVYKDLYYALKPSYDALANLS